MKKRIILAILIFSVLLWGSWDFLANEDALKHATQSFRAFGPLLIVIVMIIQSVIAPIPAASVAVVAGSLYGLKGALYVGAGALIGALISFSLSRRYGKSYVEKNFNPEAIKRINKVVEEHGFAAILIARLFPWVSFDLISYVAGITSISFKKFILATLLGMIPGTIIYVELGTFFTKIALSRLIIPVVVMVVLAYYLKKEY